MGGRIAMLGVQGARCFEDLGHKINGLRLARRLHYFWSELNSGGRRDVNIHGGTGDLRRGIVLCEAWLNKVQLLA